MNIDYIIVQAGGKGTRLNHLTINKPKAIVPVENLPMLFHLFRKYPEKKFIIIGDYKKEVLRAYLESFATVKYQIIEADGTGTCGGIGKALDLVPDNKDFMLIWSDLILHDSFAIPNEKNNYIGISQSFTCRWKYENSEFKEEASNEYGVAGLFVFKDKGLLKDVPQSGEFVRWLKDSNIKFEVLGLAGTREFGTYEEYEKLGLIKTRPFNKMIIKNGIVIKKPIDDQGNKLAKLEKAWYEYAINNRFKSVPEIFNFEPLTMEYVDGKNIYEVKANIEILKKIVLALKKLHSIKRSEIDSFSLKEVYYNKTMNRLDKIRNLVPFANKNRIIINNRECRNVFFYRYEFEKLLESLECSYFAFIHGDCTFSNTMLRKDGEVVLIDPRGYFGHTQLLGDPNYDWGKLYYSLVGNYDQFNLKNFKLIINENDIELTIKSNGWEDLSEDFFKLTGADERTIKLIHALIWLSLTTYAWQDYDSICGAFYNGLYYLEECWR